jgi:hypothetical protein
MRYPNLNWAIAEKRLPHYEFATRVGMDASRFSRCLHGRFDFTTEEKLRISKELGYPETWLFAHPTPPARSDFQLSESALFVINAAGG